MVACRADCSAGSATFTTVPSMNAMLEPRMVAARIQGPFVVAGRSHEPARIAASSQGGLPMLAIVHSLRNTPGDKGAAGDRQLRLHEQWLFDAACSAVLSNPVGPRRFATGTQELRRPAATRLTSRNPLRKLPLASLSRPIA